MINRVPVCAQIVSMAPNTPLPLVKVEIGKSPEELGLHNRWHPEIPAVRASSKKLFPPLRSQLLRTFAVTSSRRDLAK